MVSCTPKDEEFTPDAGALLRFELDTVKFDTVFTEVGTVTKRVKVYNPSQNAVRISQIKVAGLGSSAFQVFVNGQPGPQLQNVEVRGGDSVLVLVKATINPDNTDAPFLIKDSIVFTTNGNVQDINLIAYGQNAIYHRAGEVLCTQTWTAGKAHVIYDSVTVPEGCTLTIAAGAQIYLQNGAKLKVLGKLMVQGEKEKQVRFQQIRQEERYRQAPGQWIGLEFGEKSRGNVIRFAEIKNAVIGVLVRAQDNDLGEVTLEHVFLKNMIQAGVFSMGGDVTMVNSLIANCGEHAFAGVGGGRYTILYSTLANYSDSFIRTKPSVMFLETLQFEGEPTPRRIKPYQLTMANSIVWGRQEDELLFEPSRLGSTIDINHALLKTKQYQTVFNNNGNKINQDPMFRDAPKFDFQIMKLSPANKMGIPVSGILVDYEWKARDAATPDAGALEVID